MERKNLYKVVIFNDDKTTIYLIAKTKLDASCKYAQFVEKNYTEGFIDEFQDFEIEFIDNVYE